MAGPSGTVVNVVPTTIAVAKAPRVTFVGITAVAWMVTAEATS